MSSASISIVDVIDDSVTVIPLTVGRLNRLVEEAYKRCGYQLVDFGDGGGKGVLNCPKKTITLVNMIQALLVNEIPEATDANQ